MSWGAIALLACGAYAFKAGGLFAGGRLQPSGAFVHVVTYLPAAMLAGLVTLQCFGTGSPTEIWTRVAGVAVGAVAVWRKLPLVAVIVIAAAVTALLRLVF